MALELNTEDVTSPPVPAATVMVLRDTPAGMEVLLLRRHGASGVLAGAHVFPGGKVDPRLDTVRPAHMGLSADALRLALGEPGLAADAAGQILVGAIRETLEECGLLLGVDTTDPHAIACARADVHQGTPMDTVLERHHWHLNPGALAAWSRWVTPRRPSVTNRRFDTRFFVARAPDHQAALHDATEVTEATWLRPEAALRRYWDRAMDLAAPQVICLQQLARFADVDQVLRQARQHTPRTIHPEPFELEGERVTCYPGDPQHSDRRPAWEGPTRLTFRHGRFEPDGGLQDLLP